MRELILGGRFGVAIVSVDPGSTAQVRDLKSPINYASAQSCDYSLLYLLAADKKKAKAQQQNKHERNRLTYSTTMNRYIICYGIVFSISSVVFSFSCRCCVAIFASLLISSWLVICFSWLLVSVL